jgi:hypothetical protein
LFQFFKVFKEKIGKLIFFTKYIDAFQINANQKEKTGISLNAKINN